MRKASKSRNPDGRRTVCTSVLLAYNLVEKLSFRLQGSNDVEAVISVARISAVAKCWFVHHRECLRPGVVFLRGCFF